MRTDFQFRGRMRVRATTLAPLTLDMRHDTARRVARRIEWAYDTAWDRYRRGRRYMDIVPVSHVYLRAWGPTLDEAARYCRAIFMLDYGVTYTHGAHLDNVSVHREKTILSKLLPPLKAELLTDGLVPEEFTFLGAHTRTPPAGSP